MCTVWQILLAPPKEEKKDGPFNVLMAKYRRSQGGGKEVEDIRTLRKLIYGPNIRIREGSVRNSSTCFGRKQVDVVCNNQ